jgi:CheY-like chemotaxis protein
MKKTLLIDDLRDIKADRVCRTYEDAIKALTEEGPFGLCLLDHDLASYDKHGREKTGYDILCFLEANPQYLPEKIILVTANPVGRQKMQALINRLYYST